MRVTLYYLDGTAEILEDVYDTVNRDGVLKVIRNHSGRDYTNVPLTSLRKWETHT